MSENKESFWDEEPPTIKLTASKIDKLLDVLLEKDELSHDPEEKLVTISVEKLDAIRDDILESWGINIHETDFGKISFQELEA